MLLLDILFLMLEIPTNMESSQVVGRYKYFISEKERFSVLWHLFQLCWSCFQGNLGEHNVDVWDDNFCSKERITNSKWKLEIPYSSIQYISINYTCDDDILNFGKNPINNKGKCCPLNSISSWCSTWTLQQYFSLEAGAWFGWQWQLLFGAGTFNFPPTLHEEPVLGAARAAHPLRHRHALPGSNTSVLPGEWTDRHLLLQSRVIIRQTFIIVKIF